MALDVVALMGALKDRLSTIDGLRSESYQPDKPNPPIAFPTVPPIPSYHEAMRRGLIVLPMQVVVLVPAKVDRVGQHLLAEYANPTGAKSIRAVLMDGDKTFGGLIDDLVVDSFDPRGLEDVGLINYYGGVFNLRAMAPGG
ncbi:hypothetical protein [Micromonospora sp. NPDC005324]|uniref:hypothetical protein n=1 Tax=Micromonospora sp. NPDC005324 TaxID=3157033 RepID=UPI0033B1A985